MKKSIFKRAVSSAAAIALALANVVTQVNAEVKDVDLSNLAGYTLADNVFKVCEDWGAEVEIAEDVNVSFQLDEQYSGDDMIAIQLHYCDAGWSWHHDYFDAEYSADEIYKVTVPAGKYHMFQIVPSAAKDADGDDSGSACWQYNFKNVKTTTGEEDGDSKPEEGEPEEGETTDVELPEGYEQNGETISGEHTFAAPSWNPSSEDADGSFEYLNASLFTSEDDLIIVSVSSDAGAYPANWQVALGADYDNQAKWNDYSDDNAENKLFIQAKVSDVMAAADDGIDSLDKLNGVYVKLWHAEIGHKIKYSIILAKKTDGVTEPEDPENPGEEKVIKQGEHTFVKSEWGDYTESTIATIEASKLSSVDDYIVVEVTPKQAENSSSWKIGFIPQPVSGEQWNLNYCEEDSALKIRAKVADILAVLDLTSIDDINNIVVQVWGTAVGDVIDYTISIESAGGNNNNPTVTEPEETDPPLIIYPPATTEPSATAPAETEPGATVPDVTEPDVSIPDNTDQGGSEPDNTTADEPDVVPGTSIEDSGNSNVGGEGDGTDKPVATGFAIAFVPAAAAAAMAVISKKRK